jgi:hypothetical protein
MYKPLAKSCQHIAVANAQRAGRSIVISFVDSLGLCPQSFLFDPHGLQAKG